jgi:hypothetical protein
MEQEQALRSSIRTQSSGPRAADPGLLQVIPHRKEFALLAR